MKLKINYHFNFNQDILTQQKLDLMRYDVGEIKNESNFCHFEFYKRNSSVVKNKFIINYKLINKRVELRYNNNILCFINLFKKSSLSDYHLIVDSYSQLTVDCPILNIFLALGAQLTIKKHKNLKNLHCYRSYELSLQHGVNLYESRK